MKHDGYFSKVELVIWRSLTCFHQTFSTFSITRRVVFIFPFSLPDIEGLIPPHIIQWLNSETADFSFLSYFYILPLISAFLENVYIRGMKPHERGNKRKPWTSLSLWLHVKVCPFVFCVTSFYKVIFRRISFEKCCNFPNVLKQLWLTKVITLVKLSLIFLKTLTNSRFHTLPND